MFEILNKMYPCATVRLAQGKLQELIDLLLPVTQLLFIIKELFSNINGT